MALTLVSVGVLAGCTGPAGDQPTASPSRSGFLATASAAQVQAADDALLVYREYIDAVVDARANPSRVTPELERVSAGQALAGELSWLETLRDQRVVYEGRPRVDPRVVDVDVKAEVVSIVDCEDDSDWVPVDVETGESRAAPGQPTSLWIDVVIQFTEGGWKVITSEADREKSC